MAQPADHSPQGALWRAAAVPGWGQLYNGQVWKMPVVYLALGGVATALVLVNNEYILYRHAYLFKVYQEQGGDNPFARFEDEYNQLAAEFGPISASPIRSQRENLRRNRDFLIIGLGLVYGLAILDAYVSAHLLDFDVSEDLTLRAAPAPNGLGVRLQLGW